MDQIPIQVSAFSIDNSTWLIGESFCGVSSEPRFFPPRTHEILSNVPRCAGILSRRQLPVVIEKWLGYCNPVQLSLFSVLTTLARLVFWMVVHQSAGMENVATTPLLWRLPSRRALYQAHLCPIREEIIDHLITPSHLKFPIHFEVFLHNKRHYDSAHRSKVPQSSMLINS